MKNAVDRAAQARGWSPPGWYSDFSTEIAPQLGEPKRVLEAAALAGLDAEVKRIVVPFDDLTPEQLVEWRLGMAHLAPFVATLSSDDRRALVSDVVESLTNCPPLRRSILVLVAPRRSRG